MSDEQNKIPEIDLSNISNAEAVVKTDKVSKAIVEKAKGNKKKRSGKFNFAEAELIDLPSKGIPYMEITEDENILQGKILMYPMTAKEEEILSTQRFLKDGTATRRVFDRCIASDIDAKDILLFDSNFLLFYLRQISYGNDYTFQLKCQNSMCGQKFDHTVKIDELEFEELSDDFEEPIVVKLPKSKFTVKLILPRLFHSEEIQYRIQKTKKASDDEDKRTIQNLLVTTIEVLDNENDEVPKKDWEEFFEALPGMDMAELREAMDISTGVDTLQGVVCPYCDTDYSGSIPIGVEFFRF